MAEEIEIKLALAAADHRRFLCQPLLREATARTDQILDNTYFDTPDLELRRKGVALRIRRQGRQRLQTVKLATGGSSVGGLSIRPEWETPYRGRFDFSPIEVAEIREWLRQPNIAERIGPLFQTRFRRITWTFPLPAGGEILLAFDRGTVVSGEREEPISEVELELSASRDVVSLQDLADKLAARVKLVPELRSKAQRGYQLLNPP
jgi:adenylate cyclase